MNNPSNLPAIFAGVKEKSPLQIRYAICALERAMREAAEAGGFAEVDFPLDHIFEGDKYVRAIFLPKGTTVVGKIHRFEHPFTIWKGHVAVVTEHAGFEEYRAVYHGISPPGTKRAVYAFEDTIWSGIHDVDSHDLVEVEKKVIAPSYTALGWEDPVEQFKLARG